jgi:Rrf2 family transcriptional regulator, cysteine metabolism repressor
MKLSTRVQYGLRMLCQLVSSYNLGPLQLNEISEREGISEKYLGQIMLTLRSTGMVQAVRGSQGGYFLSRDPSLISIREVFECLEASVLELDSEKSAKTEGPLSSKQAVDIVCLKLKESMQDFLGKMTLKDVAGVQLQLRGFLDFSI